YPFELSGGMVQRVAIAMAVSMGSELLLADEPTSALDVTIQIQVVDLLMEMKRRFGTTIMLVTHNIGVASYMADLIAVMRHGELVEIGTRDEIILAPKQDYTKMLISSVPDMEVTV
ncbi:MAG: ABC transporter ATP-binding protein, partial [Firmicutes bacterium]|nr:ABC transporter ATP-binding protein [Bacillota bacterium]